MSTKRTLENIDEQLMRDELTIMAARAQFYRVMRPGTDYQRFCDEILSMAEAAVEAELARRKGEE